MRILINAGHTGTRYNVSPVVPEYAESARMWELSKLLDAALKRRGYTVSQTRKDINDNPDPLDRGRAAEGYDLYLSLHSNSFSDPNVDRAVVIRPLKGDDRFASTLGAAISATMGLRQKPQAYTRALDDGREYYAEMRGAALTSCKEHYIVEHSFHTNKAAACWLMDDKNLLQLAEAEAATIAAFYGEPNKQDKAFRNGDKVKVVEYAKDVSGRKTAALYGDSGRWRVLLDEYTVKGDTAPNGRTILTDERAVVHAAVNANILELVEIKPKTFPDVPADAWYAEAVNALQAADILLGYPDGTFKPDQPMARAEVATVIERILKLKG